MGRETRPNTPPGIPPAEAERNGPRSISAAHVTGNAPGTGSFLRVTEAVGIRRQKRIRRHEPGLSARRGDARPGVADRIRVAVLVLEAEHAHEVEPKSLDHRRVRLRGGANLEAGG